MKQQQFESQHAALWSDVETILAQGAADQGAARLPALYRRLCQSLALCEQRGYAPALDDYLRQLVVACHRRLYGVAAERPATLRLWLLRELPRRVRAEWRLLTLALLAFWGVALAVGLLVWWQPHWAYAFTSGEQIRNFPCCCACNRVISTSKASATAVPTCVSWPATTRRSCTYTFCA